MYNLPEHTIDLLDEKFLSPDDYDWVCSQIEALQILFEHCWWTHADPDALHTQAQVGYLSGLMDLEREDRLELMEIILGRPLEWNMEDFPGAVPEDDMEYPEEYPGPSLKDIRITRWMNSVLIEYYLNGDGHELNNKLGYTSQTAIRNQKRIARATAKQASASVTATDS